MRVIPLSSTNTPDYKFNQGSISLKTITRQFENGFELTQPIVFKDVISFKHKNHSNVYLSDTLLMNDIVEYPNDKNKDIVNSKLVIMSYGYDILSFEPFKRNINYGTPTLSASQNVGDIFLNVYFLPDNYCRISYIDLQKREYFLAVDDDLKVIFVLKNILPDVSGSVNPQDFIYISSENGRVLSIFKESLSTTYILSKDQNTLKLSALDSQIIYDKFTITREKTNVTDINLNSSIVSYLENQYIDVDKSFFNLENNFIILKKPFKSINDLDVIVLKNQLSEYESFITTNPLLSGNSTGKYNRKYNSIFFNILESSDNNLSLNYSYYQKTYKITEGRNEFTSPDNMYPFEKININDLKFIESGAFSSSTPQNSDKIYRISDDYQNSINGQYLLCTWLSGNPLSNDKIWVDRYYYPDLILKESALSGVPSLLETYNDIVEQLIKNNSSYREKTIKLKFFDKRSDLMFEPNTKYAYERVDFKKLDNVYSKCYDLPTNYFLELNDSGKFSLSFNFTNNNSNFRISSDRNDINSGLEISCYNNTIIISYNIIDPASNYEKLFQFSSTNISNGSNVFVCVSVDTINGLGYYFINNEIVKSFSFDPYLFTRKQILFGDFYYQSGTELIYINNFSDIENINNLSVYKDFIPQHQAFMLNNANLSVDDIYIQLPCGLRNSTDDITYFNSIIGSSMFKSNDFNINLYNLNVSDDIKKDISNLISSDILDISPKQNEINEINFK